MVPHGLVLAQADEPAEQHVEIKMLDQSPLGANGEQALQQQRAKKPLGGNRRAPPFGIKGIEARRHRMQNHIGHHFDPAQRVIRGNAVFDLGVAEKAALLMVGAAHGNWMS